MAGVKGRSGGRNRESTQAHILKGTFRTDRHGDGDTPDPPQGDPVPPLALAGEAKAEWTRMVDRLRTSKTLAVVDDGALYQYVQLHSETEAIKADAKATRRDIKHGEKLLRALKQTAVEKLEGQQLVDAISEIVKIRDQNAKMRCLVAKETQQLRMGHMALRVYLVEFGMTPAARSRVKVADTGNKPKSKFAEFKAGV